MEMKTTRRLELELGYEPAWKVIVIQAVEPSAFQSTEHLWGASVQSFHDYQQHVGNAVFLFLRLTDGLGEPTEEKKNKG